MNYKYIALSLLTSTLYASDSSSSDSPKLNREVYQPAPYHDGRRWIWNPGLRELAGWSRVIAEHEAKNGRTKAEAEALLASLAVKAEDAARKKDAPRGKL